MLNERCYSLYRNGQHITIGSIDPFHLFLRECWHHWHLGECCTPHPGFNTKIPRAAIEKMRLKQIVQTLFFINLICDLSFHPVPDSIDWELEPSSPDPMVWELGPSHSETHVRGTLTYCARSAYNVFMPICFGAICLNYSSAVNFLVVLVQGYIHMWKDQQDFQSHRGVNLKSVTVVIIVIFCCFSVTWKLYRTFPRIHRRLWLYAQSNTLNLGRGLFFRLEACNKWRATGISVVIYSNNFDVKVDDLIS